MMRPVTDGYRCKENPDAVHRDGDCYDCEGVEKRSRLIPWQKVREITTKGYWDYMSEKQNHGKEGIDPEVPQANPDYSTPHVVEDAKRKGTLSYATYGPGFTDVLDTLVLPEEQDQIEGRLKRALTKLTVRQRQVVEAARNGLPLVEMARFFGVSKQAVTQMRARAYAQLRRLLSSD